MKLTGLSVALIVYSITFSVHADCFTDAANTHKVREDLLRAIAKVESNYNPEALNPDSHALGVMQIIPANFLALKKYNITEPDLHQACTNINVGAWILAGFIRQYGPVWRAVGAYGVGNGKSKEIEAQRVIYAAKIQKALFVLQGRTMPILAVDSPRLRNTTVSTGGKIPLKPVMVVLE